MPVIPTHKAAQQSDFGIFLKEISPTLSQETIVHAHRDDYYIFGMVDSGICRINIDFKEYLLSGGKMINDMQQSELKQIFNIIARRIP